MEKLRQTTRPICGSKLSQWITTRLSEDLGGYLPYLMINPNRKVHDGLTALQWAGMFGNLTVTKELMKHVDIDPNVKDAFGNTALHYACNTGTVEVARELLRHMRTDINIRNHREETAVDLAKKEGTTLLIQLLENHIQSKEDELLQRKIKNALLLNKRQPAINVSFSAERDELRAEHNKLRDERDELKAKQVELKAERDKLRDEKDEIKAERDVLKENMGKERLFVVMMGERLPRAIPENVDELDLTTVALSRLQQNIVERRKELHACPVCLTNHKDTVMSPCGHQLCHICIRRVDRCPICRTHISEKTQMFG